VCILSTGDSTFLHKEIREELLAKTITIWLHSDAKTIYKRLKNSRVRPQLIGADPERTLEILVKEREPIYGLAHIKVSSDDQTYDRMVSRVIKSYMAYSQASDEERSRLSPNGGSFCIDDYDDMVEEKRLVVMHNLDNEEEEEDLTDFNASLDSKQQEDLFVKEKDPFISSLGRSIRPSKRRNR
jgi:hypothetical protein